MSLRQMEFASEVYAMIDQGIDITLEDILEMLSQGRMESYKLHEIAVRRQNVEKRDGRK